MKRIADVDAVTQAEIDRDIGQQFEAGEAAGRLVLRDREQLERLRRRLQADIAGFHRARLRKQFQRRRGDDAERPFGADEEIAQVVAGVVFFQLRQPVQHPPVGEHDFQPERHLARHAIGQRCRAAGIGGEIAADGATALGAERQREQAIDLAGARLRDLQHHAGLAGHGVRGGIDLANLVQPAQRDHDLAMVRGLPADETGIAALRHQRDFVLAGELADRGHLGSGAGPQHQRRAAVEQVAFLGDIGRDIGGVRDRIFVADDGAEFCDQLGRKRRRGALNDIHCRLLFHSRPFILVRPPRGAAGR